jgi:dolichyl-phosphate-mannose-protein mannosyltransferase
MSEVDELTRVAERSARFVSRLLPVAAVLAAIAFLIFSTASFERIKSYMDALSFDGDAVTFSRALFTTLVRAARATAAVLLGAAVILVRSRQPIEHRLARVADSTLSYSRRTTRAASAAIRGETATHVVLVLAIIALGIALRIRVLWQPINYDESFTYIVYANRPWLIAWANYSEPNNHLLHTLLAHVSTGLFGNAVWAIRLPALVAGILTIPLSYVVTRSLAGPNEGLLVSALTATAPVLIAFSVCARGYTMLVDFFLLAVLSGLDIITTRSIQAWSIFVIWCVLGFFTIPTFVYPYGAMLLWLCLAGRRDPANPALRLPVIARYALWAAALVAVCYAPAMVTSGLEAAIAYSRGSATAMTFITRLWRPLGEIWRDFMRGFPPVMIVALAAGAALGIARLWRTTSGAILFVPLLLLPALTVPVQRTLAPARVWIYLLPIFFIYTAAGAIAAVEWIGARLTQGGSAIVSASTAILALVICLRGVTGLPVRYTEWNDTYEIYAHTDLDDVAGYLKTSLATRDALVAGLFLDYPLEYYLRIHDVPTAPLRRPPSLPARVMLLANDSIDQPVERVLKKNGYDPARARVRLVRRFTYSSLYELEPPRQEP